MIADLVHHDDYGRYVGETHTGLFGQRKHFSTDRGYIGETWEAIAGETTYVDIDDGVVDPFADE